MEGKDDDNKEESVLSLDTEGVGPTPLLIATPTTPSGSLTVGTSPLDDLRGFSFLLRLFSLTRLGGGSLSKLIF